MGTGRNGQAHAYRPDPASVCPQSGTGLAGFQVVSRPSDAQRGGREMHRLRASTVGSVMVIAGLVATTGCSADGSSTDAGAKPEKAAVPSKQSKSRHTA